MMGPSAFRADLRESVFLMRGIACGANAFVYHRSFVREITLIVVTLA